MDVKQTLINLHKKFPEMGIDDLFAILECIAEWPIGVTYTAETMSPILGQKIY